MPPVLYPELAPVAILSAITLFVPIPWHWRARNVATLSIIAWLFIANVVYGIDALLWKDNVALKARVWCDITTKLIIGMNFALPAACLCICMHLEHVASARPGPAFIADKRRRQLFEITMCFGLPLVFMALHYVVQGHRFDVFQSYGCRPSIYFSLPALFIVWIPPLIIATMAMVYSALALRHFLIRRLTFATMLSASKSALTTSRYVRLMLMSVLQMVWSISITIYNLWFTAQNMTLRPWTTWADVHSNFSRIDRYPIILMPQSVKKAYYIGWWVIPVSSWLFIAFFAFGRDAVEEYKKCLLWLQGCLSRSLSLRHEPSDKKGFVDLASSRPVTISGLPMSSPKDFSALSSSDRSSTPASEVQQLEAVYPIVPQTSYPVPTASASDSTPSHWNSQSITNQPQGNPLNIPILPLTHPHPSIHPPVRHRLDPRTPLSPRPLTYPSHEAAHRGINLLNPNAF